MLYHTNVNKTSVQGEINLYKTNTDNPLKGLI
jgi:hypothetical protein